jgi:signal transduction histidine kinase
LTVRESTVLGRDGVGPARTGALAARRAGCGFAIATHDRLLNAHERLGAVIASTTDLRAAVHKIASDVTPGMGIELMRVCVKDAALAHVLGAPVADATEVELIRGWQRGKDHSPLESNGMTGVAIVLHNRPVGIAWMRLAIRDERSETLAHAIATGIGEIAYKAELNDVLREQKRQLAINADREMLTRDLHDSVGQTMYAIGLQIQDLLFHTSDPEVVASLESLRGLAVQSVRNVRNAVYTLSFLTVRESGLVGSLRTLSHRFTAVTGIEIDLRVEGAAPALTDEMEGALYRVAYEGLVNVERHARATGVIVKLHSDDRAVELSIRDDGVGIDQRGRKDWRSSPQLGLRNMARTIEELGGTFVVAPELPRGLCVTARLPKRPSRRMPD